MLHNKICINYGEAKIFREIFLKNNSINKNSIFTEDVLI